MSKEASDILEIGKKIFIYHHSGKVGKTWIYHHSKRIDNSSSPKDRSQIRLIDTSFYDICDNLEILSIIDDLNQKLSILSEKIKLKVYEFATK
jgi:hypothetical protein